MGEAAGWAELLRRVPVLAEVASEVDAEPRLPPSYFQDRGLVPEHIEWSKALGVRLDALVGPRSDASDVLVRSAYARSFAETMLQRRRRGT